MVSRRNRLGTVSRRNACGNLAVRAARPIASEATPDPKDLDRLGAEFLVPAGSTVVAGSAHCAEFACCDRQQHRNSVCAHTGSVIPRLAYRVRRDAHRLGPLRTNDSREAGSRARLRSSKRAGGVRDSHFALFVAIYAIDLTEVPFFTLELVGFAVNTGWESC